MDQDAEKDKRYYYFYHGGYSAGRRRRSAEEGEKLADKDSACWQGIKDEIKDFKDDMDKQFPNTDKVEAPACVDTEEIDLNQFKIDMMNMKKQCKASMEENADEDKEEAGMRKRRMAEDKPDCMSEEAMAAIMPEDISEEKAACLVEVMDFFKSMKQVVDEDKEVDSLVDNMEKPECAAEWDDEDIKENIKEDMMKEKEDMMKEENEDGDEEDKVEEKPGLRSFGYGYSGRYVRRDKPYGRRRRAAEDDEAQKPADKDPQCWQGVKDTIKDMKDEMDQQFP